MPASTTLSLVNFSNDAGELTAQCWMTPEQIAVWSGLDVLTRPKPKTPPTNEMGAEARSAEPVQSDPPNFLHRLWSKIAGR